MLAIKDVPFVACEREMGGTGEGVKRWATSGREEERRRMSDGPESGIWGERAIRRVGRFGTRKPKD